MSKGIGVTQRQILRELAESDRVYLFIPELAAALQRSERQIRTAVRALEVRGLAVTQWGCRWHGEGEYGRLVQSGVEGRQFRDLPVALTVHAGEKWPYSRWGIATKDVTFARQGMPHRTLLAALPERHAEKEAAYQAAVVRAIAILRG